MDVTREIVMAICPVCKSEAEEIDPGTFDGVWFRCLKQCKEGCPLSANSGPMHRSKKNQGGPLP